MTNAYCPKCRSSLFEKLKSHSYCIDCNHCPDLEQAPDNVIIPSWVINALQWTQKELQDIREINLGMYQPGYETLIRFDEPEPMPEFASYKKVSRKKKWLNPIVPFKQRISPSKTPKSDPVTAFAS